MPMTYSHAITIEHKFPPGPLWEFKHNRSEIELLKSSPYVASAQYWQDPAPKGGGIVKTEWWQYYKSVPLLYRKIITADTAHKTGEHNDFSVLQCWGQGDRGAYLLDLMRGKWEAPELLTIAKSFFNKHNLKTQLVNGVYVEDKSSGTGLIQTLKRETTIPIIGIPRHKDKVSRMHGIVEYIASGRVHLLENAEWLSDFVLEFSKFTALMNHKNDDQIDAAIDAIEILLIIGGVIIDGIDEAITCETTEFDGDIY